MNERIDLPTLLALLERYYECSLSDEDEHRLRGIIATTPLRHPAIDEARAMMGFRRTRRATKGNFAARWKVYGAVAAGLAMLVAVGITVQGTYRQGDPGLSCIAYVNGATVTDEDVILGIITDDIREFNDGVAADNESMLDDLDDIAPIIDLYESESFPKL